MESGTSQWADRLQLTQKTLGQAAGPTFWKTFAAELDSAPQHPVREEFEQTLGSWVAGSLSLSDAYENVQTLLGRLAESEFTLLENYDLKTDDPRLDSMQDLFLDLLQIADAFRVAERAERRTRLFQERPSLPRGREGDGHHR